MKYSANSVWENKDEYDIAVIGAGHAGCEAALAAANESSSRSFEKGDRVFHEKFGIGHIDEIKEIGSSKMYVIDFGKQGKKAVDALYANLKKF